MTRGEPSPVSETQSAIVERPFLAAMPAFVRAYLTRDVPPRRFLAVTNVTNLEEGFWRACSGELQFAVGPRPFTSLKRAATRIWLRLCRPTPLRELCLFSLLACFPAAAEVNRVVIIKVDGLPERLLEKYVAETAEGGR